VIKIIYIQNFIKRLCASVNYRYKNSLIFSNPKLYINDKSNTNIKNPIFLLGTASGGLTIISRIIRRHPNVISASGDSNYFYGLDEINQYYKKFIPKILDTFRFKNLSPSYGEFYAINKFIGYSTIKKKKFKSYSKKYVMLLNAILKVFSKNLNNSRLIDKSQINTLNVKFIDYALKDCSPYYVLVVSNPYAIIAKNFINLGQHNEENLIYSIEHYKNIINKCLKDLQNTKNKYLIINFDNFLSRPEQIIKKIYVFLELKFNKNYMPKKDDLYRIKSTDYKWYPIRKNTHAKYINKLSKKDIKLINKECSNIIKKLNFIKIN